MGLSETVFGQNINVLEFLFTNIVEMQMWRIQGESLSGAQALKFLGIFNVILFFIGAKFSLTEHVIS